MPPHAACLWLPSGLWRGLILASFFTWGWHLPPHIILGLILIWCNMCSKIARAKKLTRWRGAQWGEITNCVIHWIGKRRFAVPTQLAIQRHNNTPHLPLLLASSTQTNMEIIGIKAIKSFQFSRKSNVNTLKTAHTHTKTMWYALALNAHTYCASYVLALKNSTWHCVASYPSYLCPS